MVHIMYHKYLLRLENKPISFYYFHRLQTQAMLIEGVSSIFTISTYILFTVKYYFIMQINELLFLGTTYNE